MQGRSLGAESSRITSSNNPPSALEPFHLELLLSLLSAVGCGYHSLVQLESVHFSCCWSLELQRFNFASALHFRQPAIGHSLIHVALPHRCFLILQTLRLGCNADMSCTGPWHWGENLSDTLAAAPTSLQGPLSKQFATPCHASRLAQD